MENLNMNETKTATEALTSAGLNWQVERRPIYDNQGREIEGYKAITRADNGHIFQIASARYMPFQNSDLTTAIDRFLDTGGGKYTGLKSWKDGAKIAGRVAIPDADFDVLPGDKCKSFLCFHTSHDGSSGISIAPLVYRMVCKNGLHRWTQDNQRAISVRHTRRAEERIIYNAQELLTHEIENFKTYAAQLRALAAQEFKALELDNFLAELFKVDEEQRELVPVRTLKQFDAIKYFIRRGTGQDIPGVSGSKWAVYNGVTEFLTHHRGNSAESREYNNLFGSSRELRERAFNLLTTKF